MSINAGTVTWNLDVEDAKFDAALVSAEAKAKALGASLSKIDLSKTFEKASRSFDSLSTSLGDLLLKTTALSAAGAVVGGVFVKSAAELQTSAQSFKVLIGNVDQANKLLGQLAIYANNTPFEFPDVAAAAKTLSGFGIETAKILPTIKNLGNIAAVTGAPLRNLAVVFGQVVGAGRLQAENFLQLVDMGVPIGRMLQSVGVDLKKLDKTFQDGGVSLELFNKAFQQADSQGGFAFQGTTKLAETFNGRLSTLKDTVLEFGRNLFGVKVDPELGLVIQPGGVFDRLSKYVEKLTAELPKLQPGFQKGFNFIIDHGGTIIAIIGGITAAYIAARTAALGFAAASAIAAQIEVFTKAAAATSQLAAFAGVVGTIPSLAIPASGAISTLAASTAAAAIPWGLVAGAIAVVIGVLAFLQIKFNIFGKAFKFLGDLFDGFIRKSVEFKNATVKVFGDLADKVTKTYDGIKTGVATKLNEARTVLSGWGDSISKAIEPWRKNFGGTLASVFQDGINALIDYDIETVTRWGEWGTKTADILGRAIAHWGDVLGKWFTALPGNISTWFGNTTTAIGKWFEDQKKAISTGLDKWWEGMERWFTDLPNKIAKSFELTKAAIVKWWTDLGQDKNTTDAIGKSGEQVTKSFVDSVSAWFQNPSSVEKVAFAVAGVIVGIPLLIAASIVIAAVDIVVRLIGALISAVGWLFSEDAKNKIWRPIGDFLVSLKDRAVRAIGDAGSWLIHSGGQMIDGLVRGISNGAGAVINKIKEICGAALDAVKKFFGIHSPSTVFAKMGDYMMQGLANGIADGGAKATDALNNVSDDLLGAVGGVKGGIAVTGALTASGGVSRQTTYNNTYNVASAVDLALIQREQAWEAAHAA